MAFKSILKPEDSIVSGVAVAALVIGIYGGTLGSVAQSQATPASGSQSGILKTSLTKAGYTSLVLVAGVSLLARDPNIAILGGAVIIAEELHYRHAIQTDHETGMPVPSGPQAYAPVEAVSPQPSYGGSPYMATNAEIG